MNPLSNPSYLLPPLITLVVSLILLVVVWRGTHRSFSSYLFCGVLLSVGLWSLLLFGMRSSPDVHRALPWDRAISLAVYATYLLYYHFTRAYTNTKGQRGVLLAAYLFLVVIGALVPTDLLIEKMRLEDYGYAPVPGPMALPLSSIGLLLLGGGAYNLLKRYGASYSYEERNRLLYLAIAILFPLLGALLDGFSNLPPATVWGYLIFCILCSIAILKYHLLDIRVVVRKGLVYVLLSVTVAIPYVGTLFLLNQILKTRMEAWWVHAIIILLLAIILRPLYSWAQQVVDRLFYRDRYDYLRALEQFSREAQSIVNLEELSSKMVHLVRGALRTSSACLLLTAKSKGDFVIVSCSGLDRFPLGIVLREQSLLVKWLKHHGDILCSEDLKIIPQLQSLSSLEKNNLEQMGAKLFVPIKVSEGQLSGLLVLGQKLSQRTYSTEDKRMLIALSSQLAVKLENARLYNNAQRARDSLEMWLNSMSDCVVIVNADQSMQFMNRAAVRRFGRTGKILWDVLLRDTELIKSAIQLHPDSNMEERHYVESIGDRQYDVVEAPLLNPDSSTSIVIVLRDITERKQAEAEKRELEQKAALASRLASVGEMASGIAHEINNPLTGVIGFAELLMQKNLPEDVRENIISVHKGARQVASIVRRLLTFARQHKPERVYANINEIIITTLDMRVYAMKTSNMKVAMQLDPELPWTIADTAQLQQVFLNIVINAEMEMRLAHGGGNLLVKTETTDDTIRVSFKDDGTGIAKENLEKIFDPFFTTRKVGQGTGLGLSLCHGIIAEHGGRIYAESKLGEGATLIVTLPIVSEREQSEVFEPATNKAERLAKGRTLVVDDEPVVQEFLSQLLTDEGHRVETVDNASDALEKLSSEWYDLILLDIRLPGMSGIELYKRIQQMSESLANRVVFITGDVMGADTRDFFSKTSASYIAKPFDTEQLKSTINRILIART